nr:RIP metalloprotease RseP [uncultured Sphingomonas sp.]
MLEQPPFWFIFVAFVCAIGPLVFFHELGHYLVARWCGVGAEQFSIGFGREIVGWTDRRGTRWKVGWLPLGGYVRFVGDMNAASQADANSDLDEGQREIAFHNKPVWKRFLIVLAGPAANYLLAVVIFAVFFVAMGRPMTPPVADMVMPASAAQAAGIQQGDKIISIAGQATPRFEDIQRIVSIRPHETVEVVYEHDGQTVRRETTLGARQEVDRFGQSFEIGSLGVQRPEFRFEQLSVFQAIPAAVQSTIDLTRSMIDGLWQIITGRRAVQDLGGPLKMAQIAGQQLSLGIYPFIQLIALFSINLGFINLLPVPMLDGGHLMFYIAEGIRRKPVSLAAQDWAFRGGLALLLALVLFVTFNDLSSFGLF